MRALKLADALQTARDEHALAEKLAQESGQHLMRVAGLSAALADLVQLAISTRDGVAATEYGSAIEELGRLRAPEVFGDAATVARHQAEFRRGLQ